MDDMVQQGDCLRLLKRIPSGSVHLIYLDPPFNTGRQFATAAGSFDDRWSSMDAYIAWMRARCVELHRVLAPRGSFYLHCDPTASHYLRVMIDGIFGPTRFRNAIAWKRTSAHTSANPRRLGRVHDTILFYGKGARLTWNPPAEPVGDAWLDIPRINSRGRERRFDYPTQKPEALLERIVRTSSDSGDLVLDPFCGSGTTLAVAARLGRRWLGFDVSPEAVAISRARVADVAPTLPDVEGATA